MKDTANLALFTCLDHLGYNITLVTLQVVSPLQAFVAPCEPCTLPCSVKPAVTALAEKQTQPFPTAQLQRFMVGRVSASPPGITSGFPKKPLLTSNIPPPPPGQIHLGKWWALKQMFIFHFQSCFFLMG